MKKSQLTVTPSQVAAPVELETLPVAVRRAHGESVARQEVRSPCAALSQSLRLVQLLTLRTLLCSRSGHGNISRVVPRRRGGETQRQTKLAVRSKGVEVVGEEKPNYNITVTGLAVLSAPRRPWKLSAGLEEAEVGKYGRASRRPLYPVSSCRVEGHPAAPSDSLQK